MNRKLLAVFATWALLLATFGAYRSYSQQAVNNGSPTYLQGLDPCGGNGVAKNSAVINVSSATTTRIVTGTATAQIYVCGYHFTMAGAIETIAFEYGTGGTCGTGTTTLTGALADTATSDLTVAYGGGEMEILKPVPVSNDLCVVTTGTVSIQGVVTYVQQ
jgi:hypothetical protein